MADGIDVENLYEKYAIVAEQSATLDQNSLLNFNIGNFFWEFSVCDLKTWGRIRTNAACLSPGQCYAAETIFWHWIDGKQIVVQRNLLNSGDNKTCCFDQHIWPLNICIRVLAKKCEYNAVGTFCQNSSYFLTSSGLCPSGISSQSDDAITVQVGDRKVTVSAARLMSVSPVFERMLSVDMQEKKQQMVKLEGIDMEQFMTFLEAITCSSLPNPKNVLDLLALADYFIVDWLKDLCDAHLINCFEIPLIDRFFLIQRYRLGRMRYLLLRSMGRVNLCRFCQENDERLFNKSVCRRLLMDIAIRAANRKLEKNTAWKSPSWILSNLLFYI